MPEARAACGACCPQPRLKSLLRERELSSNRCIVLHSVPEWWGQVVIYFIRCATLVCGSPEDANTEQSCQHVRPGVWSAWVSKVRSFGGVRVDFVYSGLDFDRFSPMYDMCDHVRTNAQTHDSTGDYYLRAVKDYQWLASHT